jgi:hypothetical protein
MRKKFVIFDRISQQVTEAATLTRASGTVETMRLLK